MHNIQTYGVKIEENERLIKKSVKYIELGLLGPISLKLGMKQAAKRKAICRGKKNMKSN
jgi:hypothetical protein